MFNYYSSNNIQNKNSYNQISIEKIKSIANQNKQRASSINMDKVKQKVKQDNQNIKAISVNKQIQYKKKSLSKNHIINNNEKVFFTSYSGSSAFKTNVKTNINNNHNNNMNQKNERIPRGKSGVNNYTNNKLRRKMILSVDINDKRNLKNVSQYNISNISNNNINNIKLLTDTQIDNINIDFNNKFTTSNPMSNGAKNDDINSDKKNKNGIPVNNNHNYMTKNISYNNLIKSPDKKFVNKGFDKFIDISDKKEKYYKNNYNNDLNKKINIQVQHPLKLIDQNYSINLTNPGNYHNNNNISNNEKKYIKPNLKNSNTTYYKLNNNNNKYNIYENNNNNNNNYKILKEVVDIQVDMEKKLKENSTNSKSKKYNTLKHTFESLLKLLGNTIFKNNNCLVHILLEKILLGYHEVVTAFSSENRKLKQVNYSLNERYEKMSKDIFNANKIIKEKQKFIDNLQKKIMLYEKGISKKNTQKNNLNININKNININQGNKIHNEQNKKIFELNKKNLEDLDALYFYDKIKDSNKKRNVSIPKIIIKEPEPNENEDDEEEFENEEMNRTVIFSNICGFFISIGDIKFTSPNFIRIIQALIL